MKFRKLTWILTVIKFKAVESACLIESELDVGVADGEFISNKSEILAIGSLEELANYTIDSITTCVSEDGKLMGMQYSISSVNLRQFSFGLNQIGSLSETC